MQRIRAGNVHIDESDLATLEWMRSNFPDQISQDWSMNELKAYTALVHSAGDGFIRALPGRGEDSSNEKFHCNLGVKEFLPLLNRHFNKYPELNLLMIHDAMVIPARNWVVQGRRYHTSEVRDANDRLVVNSMARLNEVTLHLDKVKELKSAARSLKGTYLYADRYWGHYGHFTMETLSRVWPYHRLNIPPREVLPVYSAGPGVQIREGFVKYAFESLGLDPGNVILAREPVVIEKLLIPDRTVRIQNYPFDYFHPVQKEVWAAISSPVKEPGRKVYLSRRELGPDGVAKRHLTNEKDVENLFSAHGFEIIFPERMSFPDQLAIYRDTSVMAGAIGSNLLNAAYCRDETDLVALAPRSFKHRTLLMLAEVKSLNTYLFFSKHSNGDYDKDDPWSIDIGELEEYMLKTGVFRST